MVSQGEFGPRVQGTGVSGGVGTTTLIDNLVRNFELKKIGGGPFFRGLAWCFYDFQAENSDMSREKQYEVFLGIFEDAFHAGKLNAVIDLMGDTLTRPSNGEVLTNFNKAVAELHPKESGEIPIWDFLVDLSAIQQSVTYKRSGHEGKISILSYAIDEFRFLTDHQPEMAWPVLRVLLTLPPEEAALRIAQRENRVVDVQEEVMNRQQRDFARYGRYHINGQPLQYDDLWRYADVIFDAGVHNEEQLVIKTVEAYMAKLESVRSSMPEIAGPALNELNAFLKTKQS